ncbi:FRAS1-related extracellular matrix protein 1-like [Salvelinus alpinus]|uniref:FRAS1-related extracellular matrix protein 1-like n=1 Tax=Salvelinus alpinus TaxID=8036 RepID=UPI0039FD8B1E
MGLPITAGCDASSMAMQCLRPLRHSGAQSSGRLLCCNGSPGSLGLPLMRWSVHRRVVRAGLITTVTATSIVHSTERKATWRGHQANRVGIFSKADMDRLLDLTGRKPFWIGLNDSESRGRWEWVSGEPVTYTNWRKSPARGKSTRRCVLVSRRANRQIRDCKTGRGHRYVKT